MSSFFCFSLLERRILKPSLLLLWEKRNLLFTQWGIEETMIFMDLFLNLLSIFTKVIFWPYAAHALFCVGNIFGLVVFCACIFSLPHVFLFYPRVVVVDFVEMGDSFSVKTSDFRNIFRNISKIRGIFLKSGF